ncbi:glutamine--fructose-6-phosphate transaminase (isomerizing) [Candidatus Woesearchaeota archaeon]|nr:glutamine--fructose-6-phosphate transaminase (isomerizing) [Candidatus Woesearchaeota archaeon]
MCGIIGMISNDKFSVKKDLLGSLQRLEYRGYDSVGYATSEGTIEKGIGHIGNFIDSIKEDTATSCAIAHTRWATHGGINEANAHPHFDTGKNIFVVHNGIIENFNELRINLENKGYKFRTQTDSESIAFFFEECFKKGMSIHEATQEFMKSIDGTYAVLILFKDRGEILAIKKDSPLVLGVINDGYVIASDIYAFSNRTQTAVFFDDMEYAIIKPNGYEFYREDGTKIEKTKTQFKWSKDEQTKSEFPHYMIKEIYEESSAAYRLLVSVENTQKENFQKMASLMRLSKRVIFLACGTSYHASLIGVYLLNNLGIKSRTMVASEIEGYLDVEKGDLVVAVSQSGETMDVISAIKSIPEQGFKIGSIVNVPYSTLQRMSDVTIEIVAGQEVCVAATKTFTNQLLALFILARILGKDNIDLDKIPSKIQQTINDNIEQCKAFAKVLYKKNDIFVLGKTASYPIAREIALKLKEIPYMHAEGMMAGELKHGTIALIEEGTPLISLIPNHNPDMISSTNEVKARGAKTIIISNTSDGDFNVPMSSNTEFSIYSSIVGHLLSYYIAVEKGLPIDKPRNLAKSVTVK